MFKFLKDERRQTERLMSLKPPPPAPSSDSRNTRNVSAGGIAGAGGGGEGGNGAGGRERRYNNNCLVHPNDGHLTRKCRKFLAMTVAQRGAVVRDKNGCKLCLSLSQSAMSIRSPMGSMSG